MEAEKFLGQVVNNEWNVGAIMNKKAIGTLISLLNNHKCKTRMARLKVFQVYMRGSINPQLPLIELTGDLKETWKMVREVHFNNILDNDTLPKE